MKGDGRPPCPERIWEDIGTAFGMGAAGGSIWHFVVGAKNAPSGMRFRGAFERVRTHAPRLAGSFAMWGMTFTTIDCALIKARGREDPWNAILSGFTTSGLLSVRNGPRAALGSAVFGGVILAMIEGLGVMIGRATAPPPQGLPMPEPMPAAGPEGEKQGLFGGMMSVFGGGSGGGGGGGGAGRDRREGGEGDPYAPPKMPEFGATQGAAMR